MYYGIAKRDYRSIGRNRVFKSFNFGRNIRYYQIFNFIFII